MIHVKNIVGAAAFATVGAFGIATAPTSATSEYTCAVDDTSIVITNDQTLFVAPVGADWTGVTTIGPIATSIPAGSYTVDYTSYDDHSENVDENGVNIEGQTQEQWFIQGFSADHAVYTSAGTLDVPENVDTVHGSFGEVEVPAIDAVTLNHILTVDEDGRFPQSVVPSCISFTPVVEPIVCDEDTVLNEETQTCDEVVVEEPIVEEPEVVEEPQVLGQGGDAPAVEEPATLADTGVNAVVASATGMAVATGAALVSRKQ